MQRWVQFCLCWCLGWLHRVHGFCTRLNWAHDLTIRTLKPPFLECFETYTDSLAAHAQPDKIARVPLLCYSGEEVQVPSCAQQCWAASPLHLSSNTLCQACADLPGCQGFVPKLSAEAELSLNPLLALCAVVGGPGKASAAGEVGDDPEMWMGARLRLWLLLLPPPNALHSPHGGSWM